MATNLSNYKKNYHLDNITKYITHSKKTSVLIILTVVLIKVIVEGLLIIKDRDNANEVSVKIESDSLIDSQNFKIFRLSINNGITEITNYQINHKKNIIIFNNDIRKIYFKGIIFSTNKKSTLKHIIFSVKIGKKEFKFTPNLLVKSTIHDNSLTGTHAYILPLYPDNPSNIPSIKDVINWKGDLLFTYQILLKSTSLIVFFFLAYLISLANIDSKKIKIITRQAGTILIVTVFVLLKLPFELQDISEGIDSSWVLGLNWAKIKNIKYGTNLIFTYGPLFWLMYPSIILSKYDIFLSFFVNIFLYASSIFVIINKLNQLVTDNVIKAKQYIVIILLIFFTDCELSDYILIATLFLIIKLLKNPKSLKNILLIVLLLSIISMIKFSFLVVSVCLIILITLQLLWLKRIIESTIIGALYILFVSVIWLTSQNQITNLYNYIENSFQIVSGYSEAMASPLWDDSASKISNIIDTAFLIASMITLMTNMLIILYGLKQVSTRKYFIMCLLLVFMSFKEGFVRFDTGHVVLFASQTLLIQIFFGVVLLERNLINTKRYMYIMLNTMYCLIIMKMYNPAQNRNLDFITKVKNVEEIKLKESELISDKYFTINTIVKSFSNKTVDIIPWDISLAYTLKINWLPRPIFQSYSAYTPKLSKINSSFYTGINAPDRLIYSYKSIDNRYPLFDEPNLTKLLTENYQLSEFPKSQFLFFKKRSCPIYSKKKVIMTGLSTLDSQIDINQKNGTNKYINIHIKQNLLGRLASFFIKIQPLTIVFFDKRNNKLGSHRFIRRLGSEDLLVSSYIRNLSDFRLFCKGQLLNNVGSIKIKGNTLFYDRKYTYSLKENTFNTVSNE